MRTCVLGIDPGKQGAIALLNNDPDTVLYWLLEDIGAPGGETLEKIVADHSVQHIYLERAQAMPKQGVCSMFTYGVGYGRIIGWIESIGMPYTLVAPTTWCREMHKGCSGKNAKTKSTQAVRRLFPDEVMASKHTGVMDALLLAEYGRRIFK